MGKGNAMTTNLQKPSVKARSGKTRAADDEPKNWQDEDRESRETLEFIQAIDRYKRRTQKAFPTWTEVLEIITALGYRKVAEPQPLAESRARADGDALDEAAEAKQPQLVE